MKNQPRTSSAQKLQSRLDLQAAEFFNSFASAKRALLLLDYDGTLAPFRVDRFQARPWAGVRELLNQIQSPNESTVPTRIVFVSGRPAAEITSLLDLDRPIEVWGLHGAERLRPDGRRELQKIPAETAARLDALRERLERDSFGGLVESKPNAVVMHWRGASGRRAQEIAIKTRALFEPVARLKGITLLEFESGLELRFGRNKGGAVDAILAEAGTSQVPTAFLGDDITDEAAFAAVNASDHPHLTALVRREYRETVAAIWLRPPDELRDFLQMWIQACRQ